MECIVVEWQVLFSLLTVITKEILANYKCFKVNVTFLKEALLLLQLDIKKIKSYYPSAENLHWLPSYFWAQFKVLVLLKS